MERKLIISLYIVLIMVLSTYVILDHNREVRLENELKRQQELYNDIKTHYNRFILINKDTSLYIRKENNSKKMAKKEYLTLKDQESSKYLYEQVEDIKVSKNLYLEIEDAEVNDYNDQYFKLKDFDYYVYYKDITPTEEQTFSDRYKNFIPWNQSVKVKNKVKFYYEDETSITIDSNKTFPIIIKDGSKLYFEYNNRLGYVNNNEDIEIVDEVNSNAQIASSVAVIAYHYTYSSAEGEHCPNGIICHDEKQVDAHFKYLTDNNFFTPTMDEFEKYMDGKLQLPKKSLVITLDDGYWVPRMSGLLTKYKLNGTLFLIGELGTYEMHKTDYLEVHSHSYDLHDIGICPGGQGAPIKCLSREKILADLAKSRETLKNTTVFCWPFYEYNDYAISLVKEAGFTMAFRGGMVKATPGTNKFLIPRYTIHSNTTVEGLAKYIN